MSTVVQSTCPGCKQPLRIPSDWLTQAIRCKQCGLVLQAKASATAYAPRPSGVRPAVSPRTPPPSRTIQPPATPAPKVVPAPPLAVTAQPPAVASPAVAVPVAVVAAPVAAGSPFDMIDAEPSGPARPSRYRRSRGGWWKGPVVALSVLVVAAVVAYFAWPYLRDALQEPQQASVQPNNNGRDTNPGATGQPKKDEPGDKPKNPDQATNPKEPNKDPNETKGPKGNEPPNPTKDPSATDKPKPKPDDPVKPPPDAPKNGQYPRRALIVSVHNYLYANPIDPGISGASARNLAHFPEALNKGLHIPLNETAHLSDVADKGQARSPLKPVIEKTLTDFLDSSRGQDCILVFFIGHSVVVGDDTYLVPIEGELDNADTLIPLKWVYEQMAKCKARQKVLVVDVNRLNPARGVERSNGGPMDAKADAAFAAPPDGVEVWTACVVGQQSYELDDAPEGAFIDRLWTALAPGRNEKGLEGVIQTPEKPMPVKQLADVVNAGLKDELSLYKLEQQSRLAGAEPANGAAYDKAEAPAPDAVKSLAAAPAGGDVKEVQSVLDEIGMPPIKASSEDNGVRAEALPPFPPDKLAAYAPGGDTSDLRKAVLNAREVIWALNTAPPPTALKDEVAKIRKDLTVSLAILKDGYKKVGDDNAFKSMVEKDERKIADMMAVCEDALNQMKAAGEKRDMETKRWQVNYDFTLARLEAQYAYLFEYDSALGQMRKGTAPELVSGQNGWKLAAQPTLKGDSAGKKLAKDSNKLLDQIIKDNPGTPWEVLAKREKMTALGLQWQGAKIE